MFWGKNDLSTPFLRATKWLEIYVLHKFGHFNPFPCSVKILFSFLAAKFVSTPAECLLETRDWQSIILIDQNVDSLVKNLSLHLVINKMTNNSKRVDKVSKTMQMPGISDK